MKLPTLTNDAATSCWNALDRGEAVNGSLLSIEYIGDENDEALTDLDLEELTNDLSEIQTLFSRRYPDGLPKSMGGEVDSAIVKVVHSHLSKCGSVRHLVQLGFWRWLSNVACKGVFWQFIAWRFPEKKQINWGITSASQAIEVYFYRAWLRGQLMYDATLPDPYSYAKRGHSDIWRSQILRQDFGRDREFVKAFLDTVVDAKTGRTAIPSARLRTVVIPALRAWTASGTFSNLTYHESKDLIDHLIAEGV